MRWLSSSIKPLLFLAVTLSLMLTAATPAVTLTGLFTFEQLWLIHLSLELMSIFVSVSVVMILFLRLDGATSPYTNTIVFSFTLIALLDYAHALSFQGVSFFLTEGSTQTAIFFWLASRTLELLAMLAIALNLTLQGRKVIWLLLAFALTALIIYAGLYQLGQFPETDRGSAGVTEFKTYFEYVLLSGNSLLALFFLYRFGTTNRSTHLYFAAACYCMTMCGLALTNYATVSDLNLLIGHLFKTLAAAFIFAAIYWAELKRPYQRAKAAEENTHKKELELQTLLSNIPLGIMRFDRACHYLFINNFMQNNARVFDHSSIGKHIGATLPPVLADFMIVHLQQALRGEKTEFKFHHTYPDGNTVYREVLMVPEPNPQGKTETVLCLVMDITAKEHAERKKMSALQETEKLRKALDEHAIVAFTDAKGVITAVNKKFCDISQYSEQELIGKTHQLINSKHHPQSFFKEMWKTISKGNIWYGEICNRAKDGSLYWVNTTIVPFVDSDGKPEQYIAIRADVTTRKFAEQEAQRLAFYDELTSLPNRRLLKEKLEKVCLSDGPDLAFVHALLLIDLDNFKDVNDSLGHVVGDELLKQVGARLQHQAGAVETAARLGGDEFVILIANLATTKQQASVKVAAQAENIRAVLSAPYQIHDHRLTVTPSIGIALFASCEHDAAELLKRADIAMYQAKAQGRNQVSFFDPELQAAINNRNVMLWELTNAVGRSEFSLLYQPILNNKQSIVGCEALIRWHSEALGMVSPALFIPLAEQSNLILEIGRWVLHTACKQLYLWSLQQQSADWTLAVNVSARQLHQPDFVETVKLALQASGANPHRLKLEITESMLQVNVTETIEAMKQLRVLGIQFSLDDFGTGYSSLHYLTQLPINTLKIDRSFVNKMLSSSEDAAVVATILSLASTLKLQVVAEGVETKAQFNFLIAAGCTLFQGFLLAKPMPAAALLQHVPADGHCEPAARYYGADLQASGEINASITHNVMHPVNPTRHEM